MSSLKAKAAILTQDTFARPSRRFVNALLPENSRQIGLLLVQSFLLALVMTEPGVSVS